MAIPGRQLPGRTLHRRTWASIAAALLALSGFGYLLLRGQGPAVSVYELATGPVGQTPTAWPQDHRSTVNNDSFIVSAPRRGPNYLVQLPSLANSDAPVVNNITYVAGGLGSAGHPGSLWAIDPQNGHVLWTDTIPNSTFSEPIVAHNRVFICEGNAKFSSLTSFPATTPGIKRGTGPSGLFAYNATTGQLLWHYPTAYADQAPVTVAGGRVFLATGGRHLDVLDAKTGHLLWRVHTGVYVSRSSPRLVGHRIFLGGAGPLQVVAINRLSHHVIWKSPIPKATGGVDDTPLVFDHGMLFTAALVGHPGISRFSPRHFAKIFGLSAKTGKIVWSHTLAQGANPPFKETGTPMLHGNRLYAGNALNGNFEALSAQTGRLLWEDNLREPVTRPPVWIDGHVLALNAHGMLYSLSAKTGAIIKQTKIAPWLNAYGPVVINGTVFATGNAAKSGFLAALPLKSVLG